MLGGKGAVYSGWWCLSSPVRQCGGEMDDPDSLWWGEGSQGGEGEWEAVKKIWKEETG